MMLEPPAASRPVRVLIVDDSAVARELIRDILEQDSGLTVVGTAPNGIEGVRLVEKLRPDVVTMDIHMPKLGGFEATQQIMQRFPVPIVIMSGSLDTGEVSISFQAMAAGAVAVIQRPAGVGNPAFSADSLALIRIVKAMSEVKVVRRWPVAIFGKEDHLRSGTGNGNSAVSASRNEAVTNGSDTVSLQSGSRFALGTETRNFDLIAIGTSTGGPQALLAMLSRMPVTLPVPIVIVQHMSDGFMPGYIEWLSRSVPFPVHLAVHAELLLPGHIYLAPDGFHLTVTPYSRVHLVDSPPEHGLRPCVSALFRSVAKSFGLRAVGVLLTGMGTDGAAELKEMRDQGAMTIAQNQESCVVFGMPGQAVKLDAAEHILSPEEIADLLTRLFHLTSPTIRAVPDL
ncbi:MAG: chemotaxis-specific protein-glutamate methyltransferase CheB [Candidatus Methylacidiphilales bacterium]